MAGYMCSRYQRKNSETLVAALLVFETSSTKAINVPSFWLRCYNSQMHMLSSSEGMSFRHNTKYFNLGDLVLLIAGTHEQTLISAGLIWS